MEAGRRALWRAFKAQPEAGGFLGPDTAPVRSAVDHAVASFWLTLVDFAGGGDPPATWTNVGADHPFLAVERPPAVQAPQLRVTLPEGLVVRPTTELLEELLDDP